MATLVTIVAAAGLIAPLMNKMTSQARMTERWTDSIRAFYAAESGINMGIYALNHYGNDQQEWQDKGWNMQSSSLYSLSAGSVNDTTRTVGSYMVNIMCQIR